MTASIDYLPIWKKNSTAEEWLLELVAMARKNPERFENSIIMMEEVLKDGSVKHRYHYRGKSLIYILGFMRLLETDMISDMKG